MIELNPNLDVNKAILWERYQEGGRTRPIISENLYLNLKEVTEVFNSLGIKYCVSHGTALGLARDGDVIPWDDDIDLAVFIEDKPKFKKARKMLRELNFFVPDEGDKEKPINGFPPNENMPYYDFVAIKRGEKIECWFFETHENHYVYDPDRDGLAIPREHMDVFDNIEWNGTKFNAPSNINKYLDLMYGSNWKTPDKNKKYNNLRE